MASFYYSFQILKLFVWKTNVQAILKSSLSEIWVQGDDGVKGDFGALGNFSSGTAQYRSAVVINRAIMIMEGVRTQSIGRKKWGILISPSWTNRSWADTWDFYYCNYGEN